MKKLTYALSVLLCCLFLAESALASRVITDQLGKKVTLPDKIDSAVVLQHQSLDIIAQLNALDQVSGILDSWKKNLGPGFERFSPRLSTLPTPGGLSRINIESLLQIKPQVVFVTNYAPQEMILQIERAGIPVVAISLREDAESEKTKINPEMPDEEKAYNAGLKNGIRIIGEVLGREAEAAELAEAAFAGRALVEKRLAGIGDDKRLRMYMANPDLSTYGSGKYTGIMMEKSGGINVAAAEIQGFKQVSMEQVLKWNPEVIFVQDRYPAVLKEINASPSWALTDAVKNKRVYHMPEYAKAWGYPTPEALAIGELWMAKQLYPELFKDIDMDKVADDYYKKFYRVPFVE